MTAIHARPRADRTLGVGDLLLAAAFCAVAVVAMRDAWQDAWRIALSDEECSYVLLAPVVIGWLAWVRRDRLAGCPVRNEWVGLLLMAGGWATWWYGYLHDPVIWRAGAVLTAVGAFVAVVGADLLLRWLPAFAAFAFLVPIDLNGRYRVAGPMQTLTAVSAQKVCDLIGIYVERAGNLLSVNGVDVSVAEACNGMRMILTLFLVCYVVAFTVRLGGWSRALLLAASPVVAVLSNVIRLVPTVWMFGHASSEAAERFHDLSGWVMTLLAFLLLLGAMRFIQRITEPADPDGLPWAAGPQRSE